MYLTYNEYKEYGGALSEPVFNSLSYEAKTKIDYYTFGRLKNDSVFSENVKRSMVKIIGLLNTYNEYRNAVTSMSNPIISSQSNDGVSTSYGGYFGNTSPQDMADIENKLNADIYNTIRLYLDGEKNQSRKTLLYRGV